MNKLEPIGNIDFNKKIHIYGAGIAGLLFGYYLKKRNADFVIYEKSDKPGGKIQTIETEYGIAETAANALYTNDDVLELLRELNLNPISQNGKLKKVVWRNGSPMSPPISFLELIKILFKSLKKIKLSKDYNEYSAKEFFIPMVGTHLVDNLMSAVYRGIYSIEADEIHAASLYPTPRPGERYLFFFIRAMKERRKGSKSKPMSVSFKTGMKEFTQSLAEQLKDNIQFNAIENLKENSVICTESFAAKNLINDQEIKNQLDLIQYTNISTVTNFYSSEIEFLKKSFGILFPSTSGFNIMGILSNNEIFPGRSIKDNTHSYTFITQDPNRVDYELKEIYSKNIEKIHSVYTPWEKAIPKYNKHRYLAVEAIKEKLSDQKNLMFFGNYTNGISIREMISFVQNYTA